MGVNNSHYTLLFSAATETTVPEARNLTAFEAIVVYLIGTGEVSAGVVTIEEANSPDYAGTWSVIGTVNGTTLANATIAYHLPFSAYRFVRVRISTTIEGGTITATLEAH